MIQFQFQFQFEFQFRIRITISSLAVAALAAARSCCWGCDFPASLWLVYFHYNTNTHTQTHIDSHTDRQTDTRTHSQLKLAPWTRGTNADKVSRSSSNNTATAATQRQQQHNDSNTATATEQGSSRAQPATAKRDEPNAHAARIVLVSWQRCQLLLYRRRRRAGHAAKSISFAAKCKRDSWHGATLGLACRAAWVQGRERDIETKARANQLGEQPSERTLQTAKRGESGRTKGLACHEVYKMYVTVARLALEVCVKLCCCCLWCCCCFCCCCCRRCCCCCSTSTYCLRSFSQRCLCIWHKMLKDTLTHTHSHTP